MDSKNKKTADRFWEENSNASVEDIKKKFNSHIANALIIEKRVKREEKR